MEAGKSAHPSALQRLERAGARATPVDVSARHWERGRPGLTPTTRLHVATTGVDGPACGAEQGPCATIAAAIDLASPGAAVTIHAGTYGGDVYADPPSIGAHELAR